MFYIYRMMPCTFYFTTAAFAVTLLYASFRDIRERRVPHIVWLPAIFIAVTMIYLFYTGVLPYLPFDGFLVPLTGIMASLALTGADWAYAGCLKKDRDISHRDIFDTWIFWFVLTVPLSIIMLGISQEMSMQLIALALFSCLMAFFSYLLFMYGVWGGADAYAMIVISCCMPFYPWMPLLGYPAIAFFPYSVFVNALLLMLVMPVFFFALNMVRGNGGNFSAMFLGYPVRPDDLKDHYGFVMTEVYEEDGKIISRNIGFFESLKRMISRKERVYTKDIRENPEKYSEMLEQYSKLDKVWISYGVPFLVPITAGFFLALLLGDLLYILLNTLISG